VIKYDPGGNYELEIVCESEANKLLMVKDKGGKWYPARIAAFHSTYKNMRVEFEGWGKSNSELIELNSTDRIGPLQRPYPELWDSVEHKSALGRDWHHDNDVTKDYKLEKVSLRRVPKQK